MKLIVFLSALILFLPLTFAETEIFSGNVITGTDKAIEGGIFRFNYDEQSNKVFVQTPSTGLIVENGACKSNNVFRVCINSANFSYKNVTTYVYYYELNVDIYKLTGSLSTAGKISQSSLLQGESSELTITITNPTEFEITDILLNYNINNFTIKEAKGCTLDGNKITWQGLLQPKFDKICIATIVAEKEGKYNLAGNLSYFNGFDKEQKNTDTLAVTVLPKQLKVSYFIDKNIELNQPFYFNVSLQNIHKEEKIDLSATIEVPSHVNLLKDTSALNREFNVLKRSLILEPGAFFNFSLYLEATAESENPLKQKFDYAIKGISDAIENDTFIKSPEPKLEVNFSAEYAELMPGQRFIVIANVINPSKFHKFTSIKARLNVINESIEQSLNELLPNEAYAIISNAFSAPKEINMIKLSLNIDYDFEGKHKSLDKSLEINVKQAANITSTKDTSQAAQPAKNDSTTSEKQLTNKTTQQATTIIQKSRQKFFNKDILLLAISAFAVFLVIFFINRARKRRRISSEEQAALKEIQENVLKK